MIQTATVMSAELISTPKRNVLSTRRYTTGNTVNIYVDIDGVLLANEENLAIGAAEFIKHAADNFDVYWLTTHCMDGTTDHAIEYLQRGSDARNGSLTQAILGRALAIRTKQEGMTANETFDNIGLQMEVEEKIRSTLS